MTALSGNLTGLPPFALRLLERVGRRKVPSDQLFSPELAKSLAEASRETKRQVAVLVDRNGDIQHIVVGDATSVFLPQLGRFGNDQGRLRGLRLLHTHLYGEEVTRDDLTDLSRLKLDLVAALVLDRHGDPKSISWAYNIPSRPGDTATYRVESPIPWGQVQPDFSALIRSLEDEFARQAQLRTVRGKDGRAILVHASRRGTMTSAQARASLLELASLAQTAGVAVVDQVLQQREQLDAKTVVGQGKLDELVLRATDLDAETLIFDCNLTPTQSSGIAGRTELKIIDRTQLILDIFAQRATTRDGKLQVELAQLKYTLPKLGTKDDALSRLTGGIGGRGPGETKLEIGRRRARERIHRLSRELDLLAKQRSERRRKRQRSDLPVVAIVGYTNAGKSTLLNALTGAGVLAEDKLFATLDTRARQLHLPNGGGAILTDTVGFIRNMPEELFLAFRSTFEETADAQLLLEVIDASDPDHVAHLKTTQELLERLELDRIPRLRLYNKVDRLTEEARELLLADPNGLALSATHSDTLPPLLQRLTTLLCVPEPSWLRPSETEEETEWEEHGESRHGAYEERTVTPADLDDSDELSLPTEEAGDDAERQY